MHHNHYHHDHCVPDYDLCLNTRPAYASLFKRVSSAGLALEQPGEEVLILGITAGDQDKPGDKTMTDGIKDRKKGGGRGIPTEEIVRYQAKLTQTLLEDSLKTNKANTQWMGQVQQQMRTQQQTVESLVAALAGVNLRPALEQGPIKGRITKIPSMGSSGTSSGAENGQHHGNQMGTKWEGTAECIVLNLWPTSDQSG